MYWISKNSHSRQFKNPYLNDEELTNTAGEWLMPKDEELSIRIH